MSLDLPYFETLHVNIADRFYRNSGPARMEFTEDAVGNASVTLRVYADAAMTKLIVNKTEKIHRVPSRPGGDTYYFQFTLKSGNPNEPARAKAGYVTGTYNFSFTPSKTAPISGLLTDPHNISRKRLPDDDVDWTAERPTEGKIDAKAVGGGTY